MLQLVDVVWLISFCRKEVNMLSSIQFSIYDWNSPNRGCCLDLIPKYKVETRCSLVGLLS